ncbi:peptide/nickel transport system ATP-binding protein [Friedmanniella luteola]|uniref:Peptide/nickel transport system ATP-binding protein n=1 Tax=Friedmanniella luteola TaxID=546871 RepID=A0A1H1Q561_9ACTN|nr:ABC transporter ATP-binding protein [Friedmanniella luteola]SDS18651.1 peptide/nickel transport system ATP-binding protein [Friedmanniella luteola]
MSLLEVRGLRTEIATRTGRVRPVDDVSFSLEAGETLGLVGESGSGKTMTGMSLIRLLPPGGAVVGGSVRFDGVELTELDDAGIRRLRGNEIAMVSQDPMTSLNPTRTIGSQLREAYRIHTGASRPAADARAVEVLHLVGMPRPRERLGAYPHQLSGGMRQRVMIALGLVCEPKLLIADEPTTALDVSIQAQILELLDDLKARLSMAVLLVTHDLGVIAGHADRVAVMYGGRVVEEATTPALFGDARHRYSEALFESMPTLDLDPEADLATIPGIPPRLVGLGPGCRFAPRCRFAQDDCRTLDPVLDEVAPGHAHACFHPREGGAAEPTGRTLRQRPERPDRERAAPVAELFEVHKRFALRSDRLFGPARRVHAVSGVSLVVNAGETLGIVGESGCGKTTIGRMLVGLEGPTEGAVSFEGRTFTGMSKREFRERRRDVQMMFQDSAAALDPRMTVEALVAEPMAAQGVGSRAERRAVVAELLEAVGLGADSGARYAHEFSGGQRQRIAMARALALRPRIIVADEPVSALDVSVQAQILNLMRSLQDRYGLTYVVISHDLSLLKYLADRIGVMYLGKLVELGTSEEVYRAPRHPYTAGLIASIPVPDPARERRTASAPLGGELPSAVDPPSGCRFRTRCPRATEVCAVQTPPLAPADDLHAVACHHPLTGSDPVAPELELEPAQRTGPA